MTLTACLHPCPHPCLPPWSQPPLRSIIPWLTLEWS